VNKPQYKVRQAKLNDVMYFYTAVCSIINKEPDLIEFQTNFKEKFKNKNFIYLVLEIEKDVLGGCMIAEKRSTLSKPAIFIEIQELYITPKYRKHKAADFLYNAIEALSAEQKIYSIIVNCNINSTLTQNFYTKRGHKIAKKQYNKEIY